MMDKDINIAFVEKSENDPCNGFLHYFTSSENVYKGSKIWYTINCKTLELGGTQLSFWYRCAARRVANGGLKNR